MMTLPQYDFFFCQSLCFPIIKSSHVLYYLFQSSDNSAINAVHLFVFSVISQNTENNYITLIICFIFSQICLQVDHRLQAFLEMRSTGDVAERTIQKFCCKNQK